MDQVSLFLTCLLGQVWVDQVFFITVASLVREVQVDQALYFLVAWYLGPAGGTADSLKCVRVTAYPK